MRCVLCGHDDVKPVIESIHNPRTVGQKEYTYVCCSFCGLWMLEPYPDEQLIRQIYSAEYQLYESKQSGLAVRIMNMLSRSRADVVSSYTAKGARFLDVGCGNGTFLKELQDKGYDVYGTEWNTTAAQSAREKVGKERIFLGEEEYRGEVCGAISLWHVLEHNLYPQEFIRHLAALLSAKGYLFIEVPNSNAVALQLQRNRYRWFSIPEHVTYWNRQSLHFLADRCGFEVVETSTPFAMPFLLGTAYSPFVQTYARLVQRGDILRVVLRKR